MAEEKGPASGEALQAVLTELAGLHAAEFMDMEGGRNVGCIVMLFARDGTVAIQCGTAVMSAPASAMATVISMGQRALEKAAGESLRQSTALPAPDRLQ